MVNLHFLNQMYTQNLRVWPHGDNDHYLLLELWSDCREVAQYPLQHSPPGLKRRCF